MSLLLCLIALFTSQYVKSLKECSDYQECAARSIIKNGVSCSATESCEDSPLLKSNYDIRCTAWYSCSNSKLRANGNVYCHGGQSCNGASIRARIISCGGSGSCDYLRDKQMTAKTLAYCPSYSSCYQNEAFTIGKRLYCDGIYSCKYSKIKIGTVNHVIIFMLNYTICILTHKILHNITR